MAEKVTFDANNRLIIVNSGITQLDVETDLYSAAKRMWKDDTTLNKLRLSFRTVAGDPLGQNREIGAYFLLQNQTDADWRIRPDETDHELIIIGNLYAEDANLPMIVPTVGAYTVTVSMDRSSLTQVVLSGSGVTEQDKEDIANEVWNHISGIQVSGDIDKIKLVESGRWKIDVATKQMIFYGSDGETPLLVFDLKDQTGQPSAEDVYERVPA